MCGIVVYFDLEALLVSLTNFDKDILRYVIVGMLGLQRCGLTAREGTTNGQNSSCREEKYKETGCLQANNVVL